MCAKINLLCSIFDKNPLPNTVKRGYSFAYPLCPHKTLFQFWVRMLVLTQCNESYSQTVLWYNLIPFTYEFCTIYVLSKGVRTNAQTIQIESIEYPSDSTSYTSGDLLADGDTSHVPVTTNRTRPFDTWSHRSSSGLGSESEELTDHQAWGDRDHSSHILFTFFIRQTNRHPHKNSVRL